MADIPVFIRILGSKDGSLNAVLGDVRKDVSNTSAAVVDFGVRGATAIGAVSVSMAALGAKVISTAATFEGLQAKLTAVLHSSTQAQAAFQDAVKFAAVTPFGVEGIVRASVQLTAYGLNARQVIPQVANLASAFGQRVEDTSLVIGKALSGSLEGFESLRNEYGISNAELKRFGAVLTSTGGVSVQTAADLDRARAALQAIIQTKYGDATAAATQTFTGAMSNASDAVTRLAADYGKTLIPIGTAAVKTFTQLAEAIDGVNPTIKTLVAGSLLAATAVGTLVSGALAFGAAGLGMYSALTAIGNRIPALTGVALRLTSAIDAGAGGLSKFGSALLGVNPGIAAFGAAVVVAEVAVALWEQSILRASAAISEQSRQQQGAINSFKLYRDAINQALPPGSQFITSSRSTKDVAEQVNKAFKSVSTANMVASFEKAGLTLNDARKALADNQSQLESNRTTIRDVNEMISRFNDGLETGFIAAGNLSPALKGLFPDKNAFDPVTLEDFVSKLKELNLTQTQLVNGGGEIQQVIKAFEGFQQPLAKALEASKKLDPYFQFATKAKDAQSLNAALEVASKNVNDLAKAAKGVGLPTDRNGILQDLLTATGTRAEFDKKQLDALEQQDALRTKVYEHQKALEDESLTQIDRRAKREEAAKSIKLDGDQDDLKHTIAVEQEKLKVVQGSVDKEIALTKQLNALRNRPQTADVQVQIQDVEQRLKIVRAAADQEISSKKAVRDAEHGLLVKGKQDAERDLQEQVADLLAGVAELKSDTTKNAKDITAAYDPILRKLEAWKQAHKDLLAQSPELTKSFETAKRQVESGQREALSAQRGENLTGLKGQISQAVGEAQTAEEKLQAVENAIVTINQARASGLIEAKAAQQELVELKKQELDLSKQAVQDQARDAQELNGLQIQGLDEEISILQQRQSAGEKVESVLKAKREERLKAALAAINLEYQTEILTGGKKELADAKRQAAVTSLIRREYLDQVNANAQAEQAEQEHQDKLDHIKDRSNRLGGSKSPVKSAEEAFGGPGAFSLDDFSLDSDANSGKSALGTDRSPFAKKRALPTPGQIGAQLGLDAPSQNQFNKTLDNTIHSNSSQTYNVHFNIDGVPPDLQSLAKEMVKRLGDEASKKKFIKGPGSPKSLGGRT